MTEEEKQQNNQAEGAKNLPRVNFRFFLFCALGLCAGISVYCAVRLHTFSLFSFVPFVLIVFFALRPFGLKRILWIVVTVLCFAFTGAGLMHFACERYDSGAPDGAYIVEGQVESVTDASGYSICVLKSLSLDGMKYDGKMKVTVSGAELRPGDTVRFPASVFRCPLPAKGANTSDFTRDIRYRAGATECIKTGRKGALLMLNARIYDLFTENMMREEALISYALLTGNSSSMDEGLLTAVRQGGIAHIFAVSGLHIGIVYSAILFVLKKPLKRYACLPALALALCYSALCAFTVSSVRALIMCAVLSMYRFTGRKSDMLTSVSIAALIILLIAPVQYLSAGFTLSFGAVIGLALFSGSIARAFRKIKFPKFLADYLGASVSVQLITLPVLLETFGYASVWAILFNFVLLPCLPVMLIALLLCTLVALVTTWAGILAIPAALISVLLFVLSVVDFSFVVSGFALGAGGSVIVTACLFLTQRFRLKARFKIIAAGVLCCIFSLVVVSANCVFAGCKIVARSYYGGDCVLVKTPSETVLLIDGDVSLKNCNDFLNRNYGGTLDGVLVLSHDELDAINVGAFLNAKAVYAREEIPTGLQSTNVIFGEEVKIGALTFRFETNAKAVLFAQGLVVEFDLTDSPVPGADLQLGDGGSGEYYLNGGKIYAR